MEKHEKSAGQVERELGITPGMLLKWRARYQAVHKGTGAFIGNRPTWKPLRARSPPAARECGLAGGTRNPKKSREHFLPQAAMKYAFMAAHLHEHRLGRMARVLGVSRSGYYAWQARRDQ